MADPNAQTDAAANVAATTEAEMAPGSAPADAGPSAMSRLGDGATAAAASVVATTQAVKEKLAESPMKILVGLIVVALIGFATAYGLYWMINSLVMNKKTFLIPGTKMPVSGTKYSRFMGGEIPRATNGKRLSFTFWIYIHDINKYTGTMRHVWHRGDSELGAEGPSPFVFLAPDTNKMYILMTPPKMSAADTTATQNMSEIDKYTYLAQKYGIILDYIPLQRWVHVGVVVNENANGGTVSGYIDGELVKTTTTGTNTKVGAGPTVAADLANLNLDKNGDIYVGGAPSESVGPGFSGLVSKIQFFNYDINARDMYKTYLQGPLDSLLARMGLPAYGIRSPIYRIG